ncbi:hypothetical protein ACFQ0T_39810 [Kitasatospora gansuensis]
MYQWVLQAAQQPGLTLCHRGCVRQAQFLQAHRRVVQAACAHAHTERGEQHADAGRQALVDQVGEGLDGGGSAQGTGRHGQVVAASQRSALGSDCRSASTG